MDSNLGKTTTTVRDIRTIICDGRLCYWHAAGEAQSPSVVGITAHAVQAL